jgi:hypothetical protein
MTPHVAAQLTAQVAAFCREPKPAKATTAERGLKHWETCQANYSAPLMAMDILERTIPGKPRSRMQRYRTRETELAMLERGTTGAPKQGRDETPFSNRGGPSNGKDTSPLKQYTLRGL